MALVASDNIREGDAVVADWQSEQLFLYRVMGKSPTHRATRDIKRGEAIFRTDLKPIIRTNNGYPRRVPSRG